MNHKIKFGQHRAAPPSTLCSWGPEGTRSHKPSPGYPQTTGSRGRRAAGTAGGMSCPKGTGPWGLPVNAVPEKRHPFLQDLWGPGLLERGVKDNSGLSTWPPRLGALGPQNLQRLPPPSSGSEMAGVPTLLTTPPPTPMPGYRVGSGRPITSRGGLGGFHRLPPPQPHPGAAGRKSGKSCRDLAKCPGGGGGEGAWRGIPAVVRTGQSERSCHSSPSPRKRNDPISGREVVLGARVGQGPGSLQLSLGTDCGEKTTRPTPGAPRSN